MGDSFSGSLSRTTGENVGDYSDPAGNADGGRELLALRRRQQCHHHATADHRHGRHRHQDLRRHVAAAALPTVTSGTLVLGDTANFTESFDIKNVGTGEILIPSGSVADGNNGENYQVTFVDDHTGVITARSR